MSDARSPELAQAPAEQGPRLMIWPKRLCYLVYGVGALSVGSVLGLGWVHLLIFLLPLGLVELLLSRWVEARMSRFDQALRAYIQAGRDSELEAFFLSQRLLRFAAPQYYLQSKRGMIYQHLGQHHTAAAAFRDALEQAPGKKRFAQALNLANCLERIGSEEEAERIFRQALDGEHRSVATSARVARLVLKRGGDPEEAEAYLLQAVEWQGGGPLRVELAELLMSQGKQDEAAEQLQLAGAEVQQGGWTPEQQAELARVQAGVGEAPPPAAEEPAADAEAGDPA